MSPAPVVPLPAPPVMPVRPPLQIAGLTKWFGGTLALDRLSLDVPWQWWRFAGQSERPIRGPIRFPKIAVGII